MLPRELGAGADLGVRLCLGVEETDKSLKNFGGKRKRSRAVDMEWEKRVFRTEEIKAGVEDEEASQKGEK